AASHLLHPINEEEEDGRDESLAQPETISPSLNSTFPLSLSVLSRILLGAEESRAESFIFYCKDQSDLTITNEGLNENTFNLRTADLNSDLIKCTCRFERAGGWPTSPQSNQLVFRVHEKYWAESFIFYCKDQSDLIITYENITKNTFKLRTADLNSDQMKIKCICWFWDPPEGWPPSRQSNQLGFFISDAPPSPGLRVDPLSQRVEEGDPLVFLCSTEGGDREKKFHFYKDGVEITSSEEGLLEPSTEPTNPLQNASLRIPHASFNHSGEFACSYEEKRSNRWIMSSLSQGVNITVEPVSEVVQWAQWFPCLESQMAPDVVGDVDREILQGRKKGEPGLALRERGRQYMRKMEINHFMFLFISIAALEESPSKEQSGPTRENRLTQEKTGETLYYNLESQLKKKEQNHS
ncbi:hypothetical protein E2320_003637, partial [Naja naja]